MPFNFYPICKHGETIQNYILDNTDTIKTAQTKAMNQPVNYNIQYLIEEFLLAEHMKQSNT